MSKTFMDPELTDVLDAQTNQIFKTLNCVKVGKITRFDPSDKTAEIQILFKRVLPGGNIQSYPLLIDCPVFTLQGGTGALQMPIAVGDQCLVIFADRNIDAWFKTGSEVAPFNARAHDISDGFALVGVNALTSAMGDYSATELKLYNGLGKIGIEGGRITLTNGTLTLLTLISGLIDVITALTVNSNPIDAPGQAALQAYKTVLMGLLY